MCCSKNSMQISAVITEKLILLVRSLNTPIVVVTEQLKDYVS